MRRVTDQDEAAIAHRLGLDAFAFRCGATLTLSRALSLTRRGTVCSEQEENFVPADTDEGAYCLIRNHVRIRAPLTKQRGDRGLTKGAPLPVQILTKWRLDVTRPLTEDRACSEIEDRYRGLARLAFRFLSRCARQRAPAHGAQSLTPACALADTASSTSACLLSPRGSGRLAASVPSSSSGQAWQDSLLLGSCRCVPFRAAGPRRSCF